MFILDVAQEAFVRCSTERSFSKLKLLRNCLRSTILQERSNGLAICSTENNILDGINLYTVFEDFASRNA